MCLWVVLILLVHLLICPPVINWLLHELYFQHQFRLQILLLLLFLGSCL